MRRDRAADIVDHCNDAMDCSKVPEAVHVVGALPRDTQGKLLKRELRASHADRRPVTRG